MAHELTVREDGTVEMFYAGDTPWHALGTGVDEAKTSEEAIVLAHMDWEVGVGELYGPRKNKVGWLKGIYRKDNGNVLGVCSEDYQSFQNSEAFAFMDSLIEDGLAKYETAGTIRGGKVIWVLMKLENGYEVMGQKHFTYIALTAGHDAKRAIRVLPTIVKVVCRNTLQAALSGGNVIRLIHKASLEEKLKLARESLQLTTEASRRMQTLMEQASKYAIDGDTALVVRDKLFGSLDDDTHAARRKAIEAFDAIYAAEVATVGENAYALLNAVTGYADHARTYKGTEEQRAETRFMATFKPSGRAFRMKNKGIEALFDAVPDLAEAVPDLAKQLR